MSRARIDPASRALRTKLGAPARTMLSLDVVAQAEAAVRVVANSMRPMLLEEIRNLDNLSRQRPFNAPTALYAYAHRIRGLAGTCGMPAVGHAATALCRLLEGVPDGEPIDANLVTSIAVTMIHAVKAGPTDFELLEELLAACFEAVAKARPAA